MLRQISCLIAVCMVPYFAAGISAEPSTTPAVSIPGQGLLRSAGPADVQTDTQSAAHLMNADEFNSFLSSLDSGILQWRSQIKSVGVRSLGLDPHEFLQMQRSQHLCLQAIEDTHEEIHKLSEKQTLKLDFLLLIDLNDLARTLDEFDRDLADPPATGEMNIRKSLGYARQLMNVETSLASENVQFQHHVLAYASLADATLDQSAENTPGPTVP